MNPMKFFFALLSLFCAAASIQAEDRPNILFIAVDDLRPEFASYGADQIISPNLDRLASQGTQFNRAYCSVATCGASRASLLTSVRPTPTRFVTATNTRADVDASWAVPFNTHFKSHGYRTISLGKIYHQSSDNEEGWSKKPWKPKASRYALAENQTLLATSGSGPSTEAADVSDETYSDGKLALKAIDELGELATRSQEPFLLAVGFYKPHLAFAAPQKYWDFYPAEKISLPDNYKVPENAPQASIHRFGELRTYSDVKQKGPLSDEQALHLIRGYYACVSYVDAQIGKVLDELERLDLADNTIVILWGDHGWNLGDHTLWCKHSVYESSLRIPLIIKSPSHALGQETDAIAESIDIYPTLCALTGLPIPKTVEGRSLVPVLTQPKLAWPGMAFSRFRAGDSLRTDRYRYSEYHDESSGKYLGRMLYDLKLDPLENHNISERPENEELVAKLAELLEKKRLATANPPSPRRSFPKK
jgi:arylsulfatase A-like enzyme